MIEVILKYLRSVVLVGIILIFFPQSGISQITFTTDQLSISIDKKARISSLSDLIHNREYLEMSQPAPLLSLKIDTSTIFPDHISYNGTAGTLYVGYNQVNVNLQVTVKIKSSHISFEVINVEPADRIDALIWGPFPTAIGDIVGEIVGVVRDSEFAIGIQALNVGTLGGYPLSEDGYDAGRGRTAEKTGWGSVLQAYSLNRGKKRTIGVWNEQFPEMPVPPMEISTLIGSKIALFGCEEKNVLRTIGEIETAEGLPHPLINGVWEKISPERGRSYLIADYSENDIDELLGYTKRANLMTLYHMEPFESWGHYRVSRKFFPNGMEGLKKCAEKANALGIRLGAHTLTNFIQTHDPYITPVPDKRLATTGESYLTEEINDTITSITIASPLYFSNEKANWLHTVMIDEELIRYMSVSSTAPWKLLGCERGAFGTPVSMHSKNSAVKKLLDHPYGVFFPDIEMQREIAGNMAEFFNESGVSQMDFDGHEGCAASGQGDYGIELFAKDFYDKVEHTIINGTSNSKHFYWHINSYCNWGEPWYEGFRESMQDYRIKNQALFERNYLPNMLGWYLLKTTTTLSDIEWMLARGAGYNAGFALATSIEALQNNPQTGVILDAIREWETARRSGAFSEDQREMMKDPKTEYHLEKIGESGWNLFPYHKSQEYIWEVSSDGTVIWKFNNPDSMQALQFILRVQGDSGTMINPTFEIDKTRKIVFSAEIKAGESLLCEGLPLVRIYDKKGQQIKTENISEVIPRVESGKHQIEFSCDSAGENPISVIVQFKTIGKPERVGQ